MCMHLTHCTAAFQVWITVLTGLGVLMFLVWRAASRPIAGIRVPEESLNKPVEAHLPYE